MNRRPMVLASGAVVAAMLVLAAWAWSQLPADAQVPVHWGPDGRADAFADKTVGLFLLPGIAALIAIGLAVIPSIEPRRSNLERSGKPYGATWIGVMLLLGVMHVLAVGVALGAELDVTRIMLIGAGVLFVVIGNYLPKTRPNYLLGIRTPWTLTSDLSWTRTHRVGGRLFMLEGAILAISGLLDVASGALLGLIIGGLAVIVGIMFAYSYVVWKDDPARRTT